jgi:hypothetical protein
MRRISRVVTSSARGTALSAPTRAASVFSRGYAAPETPQTDFKVTDSGIRVYAHGVVHDMDFLGDLPADAREVLSGREWKPQSVSEFTSRWEQDAPELAQQARELEALLNKTERESPVKFAKSEAYLRDVAVQTTLDRAASRDLSPVEIALAHFWNAYSEVPSGGKLREANPTQVERVKALLQNKKDPQLSTQHARSRKSAAVVQYLQAKNVDGKAAAASVLLGSDKAKALKAALQGVTGDAKKEEIIKQHLQWDEATKAAADLTQRHPEFTELKEVLAHFPPLVHHIGEPSAVQYTFKHLADKAYKKWQETNTLTSVDEVTEKDPLLKNLRELVLSGKLNKNAPVNAAKAQQLQRAFPALLFSHDAESFASYLKKDQEVQSQLDNLYQLSVSEYPNDPSLALSKDLEQRVGLWEKHTREVAEVQGQWIDAKIAFIDGKIQEGMVQMDKFVNGTVDDILADHPEWEKEIEDDIANNRWDPEMDKKEYDHALQHYYEHHTVHA